MSKVFTTVGVLTAVRDGLLDLDAPITRYLPGFTVSSIFEEHPEKRITLRHLLSHTAGFTHEAPVGNNFDPAEPDFDAHAASIAKTWLMFPVGTRQSYSNLGIDLAGAILEEVTHRPFSDSMAERVFQPLGLARTTMDVGVVRADSGRVVGRRRGFPDLPIFVPMTAAGGAWSTAHDLQSFVRFMLSEGSGSGLLPASAFTALKTTPMRGSFGLGVTFGRFKDDLFFNHGGGGFGFLTYMAWYPTYGIGITVHKR
jgi:CubicO group peptidase (beta-lactamase class C family)